MSRTTSINGSNYPDYYQYCSQKHDRNHVAKDFVPIKVDENCLFQLPRRAQLDTTGRKIEAIFPLIERAVSMDLTPNLLKFRIILYF